MVHKLAYISILPIIFLISLLFIDMDKYHIFKNIRGPAEKSIVTKAESTKYTIYKNGSSSRMAILLTDEDSSWLNLAFGLKSIGIPFYITTDYKQAIQSRVVFVYPVISGRVLKKEALKALAGFAREKGTLISGPVLGGGLSSTFGFKKATSSRKRFSVNINKSQKLLAKFKDPREQSIVLGKISEGQNMLGSYAYEKPKQPPLATYEDGSAAIIQNLFTKGRAIAFGWDLGFYLAKGYSNRSNAARSYINDYEPAIDVWLRLIKNIYLQSGTHAITLNTVPFGKELSVIITHDVDYTKSMKNMLSFAKLEQQENIRATYFIQTKYIKDYNDEIFFDDSSPEIMQQLELLGMELASHSVSHSPVFNEFELGTGTETYPDYKPFVFDKKITQNGSILGELRVSKFLIEKFSKNTKVVSFRPGQLKNPVSLPQALVATGYLYSSSVPANNSLTHLPFQLTYNRAYKSSVPVYEFPITFDDNITDKHLPTWLANGITLAEKLKVYGGTYVLLLHTNIVGKKLEFERQFIKAVKPYSWFGSLNMFGNWWTARDKIGLDVITRSKSIHILLDIPDTIEGLSLTIPRNHRLHTIEPATINAKQENTTIVLGKARGQVKLILVPNRS